MRVIFWILTLIVALLVALFAVSNRIPVDLALWPLPDVLTLPLYLLMAACLLVGLLIGRVFGWVGAGSLRRERRRLNRRVTEQEALLAQAKQTETELRAALARETAARATPIEGPGPIPGSLSGSAAAPGGAMVAPAGTILT